MTVTPIKLIIETVNNKNEVYMNNKQLEIMQCSLHPTKKLFLLAMLERPESSRRQLAEFMNCDATHVSTVAKKLIKDGLLNVVRVDNSAAVRYEVLI